MTSASDAMKALTEQWYNTVTSALHLDPQQFQLVQGNVALGSTSDQLWAMMDSIPPYSITQYWTPGGANTFSSQYGALISRLKDPSFGQFQHDMGDYYAQWVAYLQSGKAPTDKTMVQIFTSWAQMNIPDPQKAGTVISEYAAAMNGPVAQANTAYFNAGGQTGLKAFNQSIEDVDYASSSAPGASFGLDASTMSTDTSHTWAKGSVDGFYDIFFGGGSASYDNQTSEVAASQLNFSFKFDHVATIPIVALSQGTKITGNTTYPAWYVPSVLGLAYSNNNNDTWQVGTPNWTTFFGPQGTLPRAATNLIVVNGISITLTSAKAIATSNQTEVKTAFEAGFFPFFGISGEGGWSSSQSFDDNGRITATATCPVGNPQVLGILQSPISQVVATDAMLTQLRGERGSASRNAKSASKTQFNSAALSASNALMAVSVSWTPQALTGLRALGVSPAVEQLIVGFVNTWATNNAPGWAVGSLHNYVSGHPAYTATAQVERDAGGTRIVNIVAFV